MNTHCPGCQRSLIEADGQDMTEDRTQCYNGAGDICSDGNLWCLDCLSNRKCPCTGDREF